MNSRKFSPIVVRAINFAARVFGAGAVLVGVTFLLAAWLDPALRWLYLLVGLLCVAMGVGVWVARPLTLEQIDSSRGGDAD